jgi:hypothetical protein
MTKYITLFALSLGVVACGSSSEPEQPKSDLPTDPGSQPQPQPAVRTLINRPLLSGSPLNLVLDQGFRDSGWGHFTTVYDNLSGQLTPTQRTFSLSPVSVTAPVGIFKDPAATDEKSKGFTSLCSFLGGKGPFVARVWVSRSSVAGAPLPLEDDPAVFRTSITTGGLPEGKAYDLARKEEKLLGDRTWILFEGTIDAELPSTAFFNLKFGRRGGGFMVTAPEVLATALLPPAGKTMALQLALRARTVLPEESSAIAAYVRQPHQLGLAKVPITIPR